MGQRLHKPRSSQGTHINHHKKLHTHDKKFNLYNVRMRNMDILKTRFMNGR